MKRRRLLQLGTAGLASMGLTHYISQGSRQQGLAQVSRQRTFKITRTESEWQKRLTPQQFRILRQQGTEPPFTSPLNAEYRQGTYACVGCGLPLFHAKTKFDSGTGWPSFYTTLTGAVGTRVDTSHFMARTEVHCQRCGGHLGHVFNDGPPPTGLRYCINGIALKFLPA
jgi:peptide-methionine (R)-S-oxide reductase